MLTCSTYDLYTCLTPCLRRHRDLSSPNLVIEGIVMAHTRIPSSGEHLCEYVCVNICMYVCMYVYIYIYIYIYIYMNACVYARLIMKACVWHMRDKSVFGVCPRKFTHTHTYIHTACLHTHSPACRRRREPPPCLKFLPRIQACECTSRRCPYPREGTSAEN
jgi:hypothetical protein